ncbi:MAG TPA: hypothetical protein VMR52_12385 [Dehalococcoidia bacterium]|nr:hypothetical protein [Dehalococcoidia bacterium]
MRNALIYLAVLSLLATACVQRLHRTVAPPDALNTVDRTAPFLKVHMDDGTLYVFSTWASNDAEELVTGSGTHYGVDRQVIGEGVFSLTLRDIALFETNLARPSPSVAALAVITGISAAVTVYCAMNTKACFGSCPTFYVTDGERELLQAEGFSASIAPRLEARDVDHLYRARTHGSNLQVHMVNEAYETHVVRYVNLLAVPRAGDHRVFQDDSGNFWYTTPPLAPSSCQVPEGDCASAVLAFDGQERWTEADSTDLAARETIDLLFDVGLEAPALLVASRQSLLPTYLLYQAFAYLGTSLGQWLATFERADGAAFDATRSVVEALGGIDVLVQGSDGGWDTVTTILETGPLAADVRLVPLPVSEGPVRVRLSMAKGAWRIDWFALTSIQGRAEPVRIQPSDVFARGRPAADARAKLSNAEDALVTFPGDRYTIMYRLPGDAQDYELFLESQGYYLEWMREEWVAEEDPARAAAFFLDPAGSLRRLAPEFKKVEAQLDSAFWRSKYAGF